MDFTDEEILEQAQHRRDETAARLALPCWQCGSADGMQHYSREGVEYALAVWDSPPEMWYELPSDDHCLYVPCRACNPRWVIPDGYMSFTETALWLGTPCSCPDCKLEAYDES